MKIKQIIESSTTSGVIASVPTAFANVQTRNPSIYGGKNTGSMFKGKKTNKPFANSRVAESKLEEDDIILVPGQGHRLKSGFVPHGKSRVDHEVEMAKSDLLQLLKNTKSVIMCIQDKTEEEGLEGWVQEKIIKAADYMNTLAEYLEGKKMAEEITSGGVIAGGLAYEGAKVERMKSHIEKSERKLGHSKQEAEDIAWATLNKRGMLDNKNKKAK